MIGETSGFNPQEEEWFKKGEEMSGEKLPTDADSEEITAEEPDSKIGDTDIENKWFDKAA